MEPRRPESTLQGSEDGPPPGRWREALWRIIFLTDTRLGRAFDVALLWLIGLSVAAVALETVETFYQRWGLELRVFEWIVTGLFTIEYGLRLLTARRPLRYARSFFGIVDLLSVLPTYLSLLLPGSQSLIVIRALRLLRIFRILKLGRYLSEAQTLMAALRASRRKITVFLQGVLVVLLIAGTLMYLIEGDASGFTSIPRAVYWAIVTMTTVGYGDIAPETVLGQVLASILMVIGYGILAVPTGIVSAEMVQARPSPPPRPRRACESCGQVGHDSEAVFCNRCGAPLEEASAPA